MSEFHQNNKKLKNLLAKNPSAVLVHVTDTYFIEESTVNGTVDLPGFARVHSMINSIREDPVVKKNKIPVLVLHGGDFLYPSLMSIYFHGRQMVDVMNLCKFDYCTLGNHDFDGGVDSLCLRMLEASFETVCANIKNPEDRTIIKILDYVTCCNDSDEKPRVAITGIAGRATLRKARQNGFVTETVESALERTMLEIKENQPQIKHLVVLSHMGNQEDEDLKEWLERKLDGIYLFLLGGHDHNRIMQNNDKTPQSILLKGESNCRTIQVVGVPRNRDIGNTVQLREHVVVLNSSETSEFEPEPEMKKCVSKWESELEEFLGEQNSDRIVKRFGDKTILDATELHLRKGSTNFGNFIADCILDSAGSDIVFVNSGHFRGDRKIGNVLKQSDIRRIFVLDKKDMLVKITMTQKECVKFLEHAYSEEGRGKILQISRNTIKVLQESKPDDKLSVIMIWDMLKTNDDGFTTLLADMRNTTVDDIVSQLKEFVIGDSSLFDIVEKSAERVEHDQEVRISVEKFAGIFESE